MKIGRYQSSDGTERLGVVIGVGSPELQVLDVCAAAQRQGLYKNFPANMDAFIDGGPAILHAAQEVSAWAQQRGEAAWFRAEKDVRWMTPLNVRTCVAGGRNFGKHREETMEYWKKQGANLHTEFPMGFIKIAQSMVPTRATVRRPPETKWFDYEVEIAAVIGRNVERISEKDALSAVFGYTILNDLSARELQRKEMANQSILLGKNFPGLGPLGPWILTADEVPDPSVLELKLSVNGDLRQHASCADLIFSFPRMVAHWSLMGLGRGDLLTTGSPEGVAIAQPDPLPFYLQPGDVVHAEVPQIGVLETFISD